MDQLEYKDYFVPTKLDELVSTAKEYKEKGYRLAQMLPVLLANGSITLIYTFVKNNNVVNLKIENIVKGKTEVPSLTSVYISVFVFENEAHDLFGVNIVGNMLDFNGRFYDFDDGIEAPMTIISPAQLAAREKAEKIKKAKAAKAAKQKREAEAKAKAEDLARQKVIRDLSNAEAAGDITAPKTTAGATIGAPKAKVDPRYAGFDPDKDTVKSQKIIDAQNKKNEVKKNQSSIEVIEDKETSVSAETLDTFEVSETITKEVKTENFTREKDDSSNEKKGD